FSCVATFWLGLLLLGGLSLATSRWPDALAFPGHAFAALIGWLLAAVSVAYVAASFTRRTLRVGRFEFPLPTPPIAFWQLAVSAVDWPLASAVLFVLLPLNGLSFAGWLGAFLTAQLIGIASHVPGGVGVFEGVMVIFLKPYVDSAKIVPALLIYRAVYYLLPLTVALVGLIGDELHQRRAQAARVTAALVPATQQLSPR